MTPKDDHPTEFCDYRFKELEDRMSRVERFILSVLIIFATSSIYTIFEIRALRNLPQEIAQYERDTRQ